MEFWWMLSRGSLLAGVLWRLLKKYFPKNRIPILDLNKYNFRCFAPTLLSILVLILGIGNFKIKIIDFFSSLRSLPG